MLRPLVLAPFVVVLAAGCNEPPSGLQQRQADEPAKPAGAGAPANTGAKATRAEAGASAAESVTPPPSERAEVRLALREGTTYRVTTVGNVRFGSLVQPTGYAREERLTLSQCEGEGVARACTLTHRYVHFEAEPPGGRFLENDEKAVRELTTSHRLKATGVREGETTSVEGPKEQVESPAGQALRAAHRFYCLRFPEEPIGVGAKWRSKCQMRTGGVIDTRDVLWELKKLERDAESGLRAEIDYVGEYTTSGAKGPLQGVVRGLLYFFVDAGEPHLLREEFTTATDAAAAYKTHTQVAYQFARLVPGPDGKEIAVRVDGKPFPEGPALNERAPAGGQAGGDPATGPATGPAAGAKSGG